MRGIHGTVAELANRTLLAFGRGADIAGTMAASRSDDGAATWTYAASPWPGIVGGQRATLLRLADWFALDRVLLSPDCADLFSQKVINASMGSFARVITHTADLAAALMSVAPSTPVLGCDLTGDDVHALPALRDAIIVIGSEGRGLSPAVAALVTRRITIPRYGAAESLNAACAAAIVCDNLRRLHPGISGQHA